MRSFGALGSRRACPERREGMTGSLPAWGPPPPSGVFGTTAHCRLPTRWEADADRGADAERAVGLDGAAVLAHDPLHDGEAQASPAGPPRAGAVAPVEAIE